MILSYGPLRQGFNQQPFTSRQVKCVGQQVSLSRCIYIVIIILKNNNKRWRGKRNFVIFYCSENFFMKCKQIIFVFVESSQQLLTHLIYSFLFSGWVQVFFFGAIFVHIIKTLQIQVFSLIAFCLNYHLSILAYTDTKILWTSSQHRKERLVIQNSNAISNNSLLTVI